MRNAIFCGFPHFAWLRKTEYLYCVKTPLLIVDYREELYLPIYTALFYLNYFIGQNPFSKNANSSDVPAVKSGKKYL